MLEATTNVTRAHRLTGMALAVILHIALSFERHIACGAAPAGFQAHLSDGLCPESTHCHSQNAPSSKPQETVDQLGFLATFLFRRTNSFCQNWSADT